MAPRSHFELAEIMWDVAEPCLTREDRQTLSFVLHAGDPFLAIFGVVRAVIRENHALPCNVHSEFQQWLSGQPAFDAGDPLMALRLELHVNASSVRSAPDWQFPVEDYGEHTLCYFILDEAGVVGASLGRQEEVLRRWPPAHRPSPALRADLVEAGFEALLDELPFGM